MEKLVPIIILNWNGEDDTIECLVSIKKSNSAGFFPILVDNGSQKNSLVKIKNICQNLFSDIHSFKSDFVMQRSAINSNKLNFVVSEETLVIIESSQNLGFAKGNNLGIKFAAMIGSEWVMLLNNDTIVTENTFSILKNFIMENTSFIAITPQIRLYNDKEKIWNCGGELTYFGSRKYFFESDHYTLLPGDRKYKKITFVTGCALLFKFKSTGFLSEDYFFGEEDYEFSLRLKDNQMDMACVFGSVIFHKVGASRLDGNKSLSGIYIYYISRLISTKKYYSKTRWFFTKWLAFSYLPFLLIRSGIPIKKYITLFLEIDNYIKNNDSVDEQEYFKSLELIN